MKKLAKNSKRSVQLISIKFIRPACSGPISRNLQHTGANTVSCHFNNSHISKMRVVLSLHRDSLISLKKFTQNKLAKCHLKGRAGPAGSFHTFPSVPGLPLIKFKYRFVCRPHVTMADYSWQLSNLQLKTSNTFINNSLSWKTNYCPEPYNKIKLQTMDY